MYKVRKPTPPKLMLMSSADIVEVDSVALQQILIIVKQTCDYFQINRERLLWNAIFREAFPNFSSSIKFGACTMKESDERRTHNVLAARTDSCPTRFLSFFIICIWQVIGRVKI